MTDEIKVFENVLDADNASLWGPQIIGCNDGKDCIVPNFRAWQDRALATLRALFASRESLTSELLKANAAHNKAAARVAELEEEIADLHKNQQAHVDELVESQVAGVLEPAMLETDKVTLIAEISRLKARIAELESILSPTECCKGGNPACARQCWVELSAILQHEEFQAAKAEITRLKAALALAPCKQFMARVWDEIMDVQGLPDDCGQCDYCLARAEQPKLEPSNVR